MTSTIPYVPSLDCSPGSEFLFANYVMVEWFGAAADGVTDDTDAFVRAMTDGRPIGLDASKTYAIEDVVIAADAVCPGIFSIGGQARIVSVVGATSANFFFVVLKADGFTFENIFFDMPANTTTTIAFNRAIFFEPDGNTGTNYRVANCKFSGGGTSMSGVGYIITNSRFAENYITGTYGDCMSFNCLIDVEITDNIIEDSGIGTTGSTPSGAIRTGTNTQLDATANLTIARNTITRCCVAVGQSAIDCFSGAARNILIADNVCSYNGNGIELKTMVWTQPSPPPPGPDVYEGNVVANNIIRLLNDASTSGVTAFHAQAGAAKGKASYLHIHGNTITCNPPVAANAFSHTGISVAGHDHVTIDSNTVIGVGHGIAVGGTGPLTDTADNIVVTNNTVDAVEFAFNHSGGTVNSLYIRNNPLLRNALTATGPAIIIALAGTDIEISGNRIESLARSAVELRTITSGRLTDNTLIGAVSSVITQGTAVSGLLVRDNELVATTGPACNLSTGTGIEVQNNNVAVPIGSRTWSGAATVTAADNSRGMVIIDPTGTAGGALGDTFGDLTGATAGWRCTILGSAGVAVFGAVIRTAAPTTQTGATYTVLAADTDIIADRAGTVTLTLPAAASYPGRQLHVRTIQAQTVVSATSNVVPLVGGAAGTAILAATAGKWARLVSDGTNWQIMAAA